MKRLVPVLLVVVAASCRKDPISTESTTNERTSVIFAREPLPSLPAGLTLRLIPHPVKNEIEVELHLVGPDALATKELGMAKEWAGIDGFASIRGLRVRDARGEIAARPGPDSGPDRTLWLERPAQSEHLEIRYGVISAPAKAPRFAVHLDRERFSGVGHTFLLLPRLDKPLPVHVQIRSNALAPGASGATSFGGGDEIETSASPREIAHAVYASGKLRVVEKTNAGRLLVLGRPAFEPNDAHATISKVHRALERTFVGAERKDKLRDFSYVVMAEPGLGKGHDGALLGRSFGLWMGADAAFDAPKIIAATHELAHSWIGRAVRLDNERGEEQEWFSEGFAVHYARKVALAEKLITPDEFAEDLERTLGPGVSDWGAHPTVRSREAYQRGALYAASMDAAMRKSTRGERSLDDLLRKLFIGRNPENPTNLPVTTLRELIIEELGTARGEEMSWVMVQGHGEIRLDDDAFGPCFTRAKTRTKEFELGFDRASMAGIPQVIRGLVPGSAAARAGLVDGAIVLSSKLPSEFEKDADKPVEIVVAAPRGSRTIRYLPVAEREEVHWAAKKRCVP